MMTEDEIMDQEDLVEHLAKRISEVFKDDPHYQAFVQSQCENHWTKGDYPISDDHDELVAEIFEAVTTSTNGELTT